MNCILPLWRAVLFPGVMTLGLGTLLLGTLLDLQAVPQRDPTHSLDQAIPLNLHNAVTLQSVQHAQPSEHSQESQPILPKIPLKVGSYGIQVEVADQPQERERGLMFRTHLERDEGMLLVMDFPGPVALWMRNTLLPLSVACLNADGMILEIFDLEPLSDETRPCSFPQVAYALEMPQGWFSEHQVRPGEVVQGLPALSGMTPSTGVDWH